MPIFDRAFLHYQIDLLTRVPEIDEIILSLNYQPRKIEEVFGAGEGTGVKLRYVVEPSPPRHRRRHPLRGAGHHRHARRVQRRRDDVGGRQRRAGAPPLRRRPGHDRPHARGEPVGLRPRRDQRRRPVTRFLEKPGADEITCDTINAGIYVLEPETFDRIPKDVAYSIERGYFPSLTERGETFAAYVDRGHWIDIGTPEKPTSRCTATCSTAASRPVSSRAPRSRRRWSRPRPAWTTAPRSSRPASSMPAPT
ncbi:MAG: NDP-sugar synthase [Vicinamibacterales bacterium]